MSIIVELAEYNADEGSIIVFTGNTEDGERIRFGVDHRPASELLERMFTEQGDETAEFYEGIYVAIEPWQVLPRDEP